MRAYKAFTSPQNCWPLNQVKSLTENIGATMSHLGCPLRCYSVPQGPTVLEVFDGRLSDVAHLPHFSVHHVAQSHLPLLREKKQRATCKQSKLVKIVSASRNTGTTAVVLGI